MRKKLNVCYWLCPIKFLLLHTLTSHLKAICSHFHLDWVLKASKPFLCYFSMQHNSMSHSACISNSDISMSRNIFFFPIRMLPTFDPQSFLKKPKLSLTILVRKKLFLPYPNTTFSLNTRWCTQPIAENICNSWLNCGVLCGFWACLFAWDVSLPN